MPISIDFPQGRLEPRGPRSPRLGRKLIVFLIVIAAILFAAKTALSYWVDLLWFRSLGYADVFWTTWRIEWGVFALFAIATFVVLYGAFLALKRASQASLPSARQIILGGQPVNLSIEPVLRIVGIVGSLAVAALTGTAMMAEWPTLALFWYAPHASGSIADPIFGRPLNFFLFTLPAWQLLLGWLLTLAVILCVVAVVLIAIAGGFSLLDKRAAGHSVPAWRGLSITVAFLLLVVAMNVFVSRFQCLLDHHTIFEGVNYTDAHVTIAGLLIVSLALLFGAGIALFNALRGARAKLLVASVVPAVFCYLAMSVVGWYVGNFIVKPNELVRETPYIANNIKFTQQAYGLDQFQQREFPAETTVDAADPADNQPTLQNIRLWDWHALQDTLRQEQEIRTYYDFPDIDIDRYNLDGALREVMLAARELNVEKLPESSRNWINEKLVYTHGYGVTMNPVNGFTSEGLPTLMLSNMPVQSTVKGLNVTRPEIYFGELTDTDVYVKTRQQEFDFPQGQTNSVTSYQGTGGIVLGGLMRRILLAAELDDLGKLPFSDDVNTQSRLLMRRNIRERVATLAPFLTFDQDPYIVVGDDGRLSWMMDAFTTSDSYPYSKHTDLDDNSSINYMRNSVKVVIDAYNGTTTFYVFDNNDPVLAAYRRIFPSLFKDASLMPAGPAQARALPGEIIQAAGGGLWPLPHDRPGGLLQPRGPMDGGHRDQRPEQRWTADNRANAAQLRPDEAARRERRGVRGDPSLHAGQPQQPDRMDRRALRPRALRHVGGLRLSQDQAGGRPAADRVAHRPERAALRPVDAVEPAGIACRPRKPARHPLRQGAALCRADLPAGPAEPHAGAAPGRPRAAGQAGLWADLRVGAGFALRRRDLVAEFQRIRAAGCICIATSAEGCDRPKRAHRGGGQRL